MKQFFITLWTLVFVSGAFGQNFYLNEVYDFGADVKNMWSILENDMGYLMVGNVDVANGPMVFVQLNFQGKKVWEKSISDVGLTYSAGSRGKLIPTSSGGYALFGTLNSQPSFFQFDQNMQLSSSSNISTPVSLSGAHSRTTPDGGFVLCGTTTKNDVMGDFSLVKLNGNSSLQWDQLFDNGSFQRCNSIDVCADSGFVIVGTTSVGLYEEILVIKTDQHGTVDWPNWTSSSSGAWANHVEATADGGAVLAGGINTSAIDPRFDPTDYWSKPYVVKLDASGNNEWSTTIGDSGFVNTANVVRRTSQGYIVAGRVFDFSKGFFSGMISKVNEQGEVIWYRKLTSSNEMNHHILHDIQPTSNGGFIAVGGSGPNAWVIFLDSEGCPFQHCDAPVGLTEPFVGGPVVEDFIICPNPSQGQFRFDQPMPDKYRIEVIDIHGRKVEHVQLSENEVRLDNAADGIYFVILKTTKNVRTQRLVVQRQ